MKLTKIHSVNVKDKNTAIDMVKRYVMMEWIPEVKAVFPKGIDYNIDIDKVDYYEVNAYEPMDIKGLTHPEMIELDRKQLEWNTHSKEKSTVNELLKKEIDELKAENEQLLKDSLPYYLEKEESTIVNNKKIYEEVEIPLGTNIAYAIQLMKEQASKDNTLKYIDFNGMIIHSDNAKF